MKLLANGACGACALLLASCVSLTERPRALVYSTESVIRAQSLSCAEANRVVGEANGSAPPLDRDRIRVLTWNIHKQADKDWQRDLGLFAHDNDLVLLQEVSFDDSLLAVLEAENLHWVMASSFLFADRDLGVLTASRATPIASCTQRIVEPVLRLPKSAIISWFRLRDSAETLAVVNIHAVNFSLWLGAYRSQFDALGEVLAEHRGPIILAGDLNTWTDARTDAVATMARRLGLEEIRFDTDRRTLFMGMQLDHIFVRGLSTMASGAYAVESSDHNPVAAILKVAVPARAR